MIDFTDFEARSRHAADINEGYSGRLDGIRKSQNPHIEWVTFEGSDRKHMPFSAKAEAWQCGWDLADRDERLRNRRP